MPTGLDASLETQRRCGGVSRLVRRRTRTTIVPRSARGTAWTSVTALLLLATSRSALSASVLATGDMMVDDAQQEGNFNDGTLYDSRQRRASLRGKAANDRRLVSLTTGMMGESYDIKEHLGEVIAEPETEGEVKMTEGTVARPPVWDSTLCMTHWGKPELQNEVDPNGYVIYVNGREQLGGNKYLVSDGLFMARSLGRTFVEYPVKDARVWTFGESEIGLGAYWDLSELCMYHRILDLPTFRNMLRTGKIDADRIQTVRSEKHEVIMHRLETEREMRDYFKPYEDAQVIVMESTWKSSLDRLPMQFMRPNPFFMGVVRMILEEQKDWDLGNFIAVQWRTETATGNITECYHELKSVVEEHRLKYGLGTHQVLFNVDLYGQTSGTYKPYQKRRAEDVLNLIAEDYPDGLTNRLHQFVEDTEDGGVRAFVSGLAVASARVMIASSMNDHETGQIPEAAVCQKPYSGYIHLIDEWRAEITNKEPDTTVRLWPFEAP